MNYKLKHKEEGTMEIIHAMTITSKAPRKKDTLYISGKITGMPNLNKNKFLAAELLLRHRGFNVINPHTIPDTHHDKSWEAYMKECLVHLIKGADCVVVLDCWRKSRGAIREVMVAQWLNIPVVTIETFDDVTISFWMKIKLLLNLI